MMKYLPLLLIVTLSAMVNGCATILTGTTQRMTIDSTPQGAEIMIDGRIIGTTPAKVRLDRDLNAFLDDGKAVELQMNGYVPDGYVIGADIEPTFVLNVLLPFGFALDAVTGAIMRYDSDYYNFRLIPLSEATFTTPTSHPDPDESISTEDDYEKLMKLVELYEKGMITEEEFEAEKAKIFEKKRE
ncbi:MAG: SHOCT domain-containing protein [Bacteroidales bacterium]|nr:SHOCT domain-containing protein [Bacteroidales bacterium]